MAAGKFLQNGANDGTDGTFRALVAGDVPAFPAGTVMLFKNTAAPPGWTRVTSDDDALPRIVGSATPGSGGSNGFVASFNSQTTTGGGTTGGSTTGGTSLSIAQLAQHNHNLTVVANCNAGTAGVVFNGTATANNTTYVQNTGSGSSHTHSIPGLSIPGLSIVTGIKYVDFIECSKN